MLSNVFKKRRVRKTIAALLCTAMLAPLISRAVDLSTYQ